MQTTQGYPAPQAARAAGIDEATRRNWQRQGILQHCGTEPRPSYPRTYPREGVYELALLQAMTSHGVDRSLVLCVIRDLIGKWLTPDEPNPILQAHSADAKRVLGEYRDLTRPAILVFTADGVDPNNLQPAATAWAFGWSDVQRAIQAVRKVGKPTLVASASWVTESQPGVPGPQSPVIHIVNFTAILAGVDARLNALADSES